MTRCDQNQKLPDLDVRLCCLSDEVAKFLLHVKTLAYHDKPDYQHLQDVLSCGITRSLDFTLPTAGAPKKVEGIRTPEVQSLESDAFHFVLWPQHWSVGCTELSLNSCIPPTTTLSSEQVCSWRRNAILHQFTTITS